MFQTKIHSVLRWEEFTAHFPDPDDCNKSGTFLTTFSSGLSDWGIRVEFTLLKCIKMSYVCCLVFFVWVSLVGWWVFFKWPHNISLIDHDKELGNNCLSFTAFPKQAANPVAVTRGRV